MYIWKKRHNFKSYFNSVQLPNLLVIKNYQAISKILTYKYYY